MVTDGAEASQLVEFAGRACYETWDKPNPHTATNAAYVRHVLDVGHLTVLEHATATMYLRGVAFLCRGDYAAPALSFSQLSQRYVPAQEARVVVPEHIKADEHLTDLFLRSADLAHQVYEELLEGMDGEQVGVENKRRPTAPVVPTRCCSQTSAPSCTGCAAELCGNSVRDDGKFA